MPYEDPQDMGAVIDCHKPRQKKVDGKLVTIPAYKHQEYPKVVYHTDKDRPQFVNSPEEEKAMIAKGWQLRLPEGFRIEADGRLIAPEKPDKKNRVN